MDLVENQSFIAIFIVDWFCTSFLFYFVAFLAKIRCGHQRTVILKYLKCARDLNGKLTRPKRNTPKRNVKRQPGR